MSGIRWTQQDYKAALDKIGPTKRPKYGNKKTVVDGIEFDSKKEAARWTELKLMQQAGQITELRCHGHIPLIVKGNLICDYVADFTYYKPNDSGRRDYIVEDVKSKATKTPLYQLKKKLMRACYNIEIVEV